MWASDGRVVTVGIDRGHKGDHHMFVQHRIARSRRVVLVPALVLAGAALVGLPACGKATDTEAAPTPATTAQAKPHVKGPADSGSPKDGGKLVMALEADAEGLDPTRFAFASSGHFIASAVFDPIATLNDEGKPVPYLASKIVGSDNNKTWTITIPDGVKFSDGDKLDAEVVYENLKAHRTSLITRAAMVTVESIERKGSDQVEVKLTKPWTAFPTVMTSQIGYVISPKMIENPALNRTPIGSGPFVYDARTEGEKWSFKKNTSYRQAGKPHLDAIEFRIVTDETERVTLLQKGEADMIHSYKPDQVLNLRAGQYKLVDYNLGEEDFIMVNHGRLPFKSKTARLAVAHATDSEGWRKEVTKGIEAPANSPFAPGQPGYEENNGFPVFDAAKAAELVKQYEKEENQALEITFQVIDNPGVIADAQYFKKSYEAAGMKVTIQVNKQIGLVAQTATGNFDLAMFRNFGFHDPDTDIVFWRGESAPPMGEVALNFPRFKDERVDAAIDKATAATNDADRDSAYRALQKVFAEEIPYIWLGRPNWVLAANPVVNGMYAGANGSIQTLGAKTWLADLWLSK